MKKKLIITAFAAAICMSFTVIGSGDDTRKFIGSWTGSEKDNQIKGMTKHWIQTRNADGTFVLMFTAITDCEVEHMVERGKWWLKDGMFYELHEDGKTDIYSYKIIDDNHIKFKAKKMTTQMTEEAYEFIDTKIGYEND